MASTTALFPSRDYIRLSGANSQKAIGDCTAAKEHGMYLSCPKRNYIGGLYYKKGLSNFAFRAETGNYFHY